jgi:ABC-2 type transport system permease protein
MAALPNHPERTAVRHPLLYSTTIRAHLIALQTILIKETLRFLRIWIQTLLPPAVTMALYFIIFGKLIGSQLGPVEGLSYTQFIAPGLIMLAVITNAYSNVVSSFFSAKFQRHIEEMLVSPLPNTIIVLGFVGGGVARGLAVGSVVTVVSLFFTNLHWQHPFIILAVMILTSMLFALGGLINGIFARSFDDISIIPTFVLTPLIYLGGIFYSVKMLPPFWQDVSLLNPILYMINAFRFGILGVSDVDVYLAFAIILLFIAVLFGVSLWLLHRGTGIRA